MAKSTSELPIISFENVAALEQWYEEHQADIDGLWVKIAKKESGIPSVNYAQALDVALCFGWIDGQKLKFDDHYIFVAAFIGSPPLNLFKGHYENGQWQGENFGGYAMRKDLPEGMAVTAGIRAEHMFIQEGGTPGVVEQVVPMLAERHQLITVHLAGETWTLTASLDQHVERGSTIYCGLLKDELLFFDTKTGIRIG